MGTIENCFHKARTQSFTDSSIFESVRHGVRGGYK